MYYVWKTDALVKDNLSRRNGQKCQYHGSPRCLQTRDITRPFLDAVASLWSISIVILARQFFLTILELTSSEHFIKKIKCTTNFLSSLCRRSLLLFFFFTSMSITIINASIMQQFWIIKKYKGFETAFINSSISSYSYSGPYN